MAESAKWDAGLYDEKHSFVWKMADGLLDLLHARPNEQILDVGCGTGHLTAKIASRSAKVTGIDRSTDMIAQARMSYPAIRFEVMDARHISLPGPYDAVFSNATLHWITEPDKAIEGISRVLRPGGRFVAEFGGRGNNGGLMKAAEIAWNSLVPGKEFPRPWYYPSLAEYATLLEKHGMEVNQGLLFDRPTPLEDGERGLRNWLSMFGAAILDHAPEEVREALVAEIELQARPGLFADGRWIIDYRRLRILSRKL